MTTTTSIGRGYTCAVVAAILYGIQYTPVKAFPVYDGSKFQWFMSCGIAFSGLGSAYMLSSGPLVVIPHGLLGGILWGTANVLVLPTVKFLGLGVGFAMYHSINMCVGYAIGRFGLLGAPKESASNSALRDAGLWLLVISLVFMIFVEPEIVDAEDKMSPRASSIDSSSYDQRRSETERARMDRLLNQAALRYQARKVHLSEAAVKKTAEKMQKRVRLNSADMSTTPSTKYASSGYTPDVLSPPQSLPAPPKLQKHLSLDQLDDLSMNAGVRMARSAYQNWRRGLAKGSVETSAGVVGAYARRNFDHVQGRARRFLWPLFLEGADATVQTRYRSMISSSATSALYGTNTSRRATTLNAMTRQQQRQQAKNKERESLIPSKVSESSPSSLEAGSSPDKDHYALSPPSQSSRSSAESKKQRFIVGALCGVFAGLFCGTNMLPFVLYINALPQGAGSITWNQTMSFMFSQTFGVFIAATICLAIFTSIAFCLDITLQSPAVWPPWIAGTIWTAGFLLASVAVSDLGMAQAYTYDAIGPVMLSAVISFFCGEIVGSVNTTLFIIALALQTTGVICIALGA